MTFVGLFHPGIPPWLLRWADETGAVTGAIETGTFRGDSAATLRQTFGNCITIERDHLLAQQAADRFADDPNIVVRCGSSRDVLPEICADLAEPAIFWLDGHWSGAATAGSDDPCPVLAEIEAIGSSRQPASHIIAVDDARLFGFGHDLDPMMESYPRMVDLLTRIEGLGLRTFILDDVVMGVPPDLVLSFLALSANPDIHHRGATARDSLSSNGSKRRTGGSSPSPVRRSRRLAKRLLTNVGRRWGVSLVQLSSGAGNQLFQYAAATSLSGPDRVRAIPSGRATKQMSINDLLPGYVNEAGPIQRRVFSYVVAPPRSHPRVIDRIVRPVTDVLRSRVVTQSMNEMQPAFTPRRTTDGHRLLRGYFQHRSWYEPGDRSIIAALVERAPTAAPEWERAAELTVISTRRRDYEPLGWALPESYFDEALDLLDSGATTDAAIVLVIVGDDPSYTAMLATRLRDRGRTVVATPQLADDPAVSDFWLIARARDVIMSNSTFCWWATRTGDALPQTGPSARRVIYPTGWLHGSGADLMDPTWTPVTPNAGSAGRASGALDGIDG